jgi:hypothetical protein
VKEMEKPKYYKKKEKSTGDTYIVEDDINWTEENEDNTDYV